MILPYVSFRELRLKSLIMVLLSVPPFLNPISDIATEAVEPALKATEVVSWEK